MTTVISFALTLKTEIQDSL